MRAGLRRAALAGTNADNKIVGATDDEVDAPDAVICNAVTESVIRAADPPGADGVIQAFKASGTAPRTHRRLD